MQGIFRIARHLAIIALIARALLPMGWMPAAHGLIICSMDAGTHQPAPDSGKDHNSHEECPFAAAPHLASVPDLPQLTLPSFHAFAAVTDRAYASAVAARFTPQSPRAPPRFV
ncbi:MAG TPA: DUF2946 family protein [Rhizomicrobium sp.]|jgi:hypothetical protein|nr:DUF2946 family protein [Rhizomicrobium sp.]